MRCKVCKKNPCITDDEYNAIPYSPFKFLRTTIGYCVRCMKNFYKSSDCYDCSMCIETRKFLEESDKQFVLIGYSFDQEVWLCLLCGKTLPFRIYLPSSSRDVVHQCSRKEHIKICQGRGQGLLTKGAI